VSLFKALGMNWHPDQVEAEVPGSPHPFLRFIGTIAKAIEASAKPRETPFAREVEARIEPLLASGPVRIEQIASAMGLSRQTLYRRLKAEGLTFEALLSRVRRRLALKLVRDGLAVKEVAYRLGFSDPAAFSRAFKRWTGSSPSASRR
jgi:AraC-like DNA-binding protein